MKKEELKEFWLNEVKKHTFSILIFYRGSWCAGCKSYLQECNLIVGKVRAMGGEIYAVCSERPKSETDNPKFKLNLSFVLMSDFKNVLAHLYEMPTLETSKFWNFHRAVAKELVTIFKSDGGDYDDFISTAGAIIVSAKNEVIYKWKAKTMLTNFAGGVDRLSPEALVKIAHYHFTMEKAAAMPQFPTKPEHIDAVFNFVMTDPRAKALFKDYLRFEKNVEMAEFIEEVDTFREDYFPEGAGLIYMKYFSGYPMSPICINEAVYQSVDLQHNNNDAHVFDVAYQYVLDYLKSWSLVGFAATPFFQYVFDHPQLQQYFNIPTNTKIEAKLLQQEDDVGQHVRSGGTQSPPNTHTHTHTLTPTSNTPSSAPSTPKMQRVSSATRSPRMRVGSDSDLSSSTGSLHSGMDGIDLSGLGLVELPRTLVQLDKLEILRLSHNNLSELNLQKTEFATTLKELSLSSNALTSFKEVGTLPNLELLDLSHNKLRRFGMASAKHLTYLDLSHNFLNRIPKNIEVLTQLAVLNFSHNNLTKVSGRLFGLTNLAELNLSNNKLTSLPSKVSQLSNMFRLDVGNNKLEAITKGLVKCTKLEEIVLSNNEIKKLPSAFCLLPLIKVIELSGNQLANVPVSVLSCGTATVMSHLREMFEHSRKTSYVVKMNVFGLTTSNDTSLFLEKLIDKDDAVLTPPFCQYDWRYSLKLASREKEGVMEKHHININMWCYSACDTHNWQWQKLTVTADALFLVIFDTNAENAKVEALISILQNIHAIVPNAKVVIVILNPLLLKSGSFDVMREFCKSKLGSLELDYWEINGTKSKEFDEFIKQRMAGFPKAAQTVPKTWVLAKQLLLESTASNPETFPVYSEEEFTQMVLSFGIKSSLSFYDFCQKCGNLVYIDGKYFVIHPSKIFRMLARVGSLPLHILTPPTSPPSSTSATTHDLPYIDAADITSISTDPKFINLMIDLELIGLNFIDTATSTPTLDPTCTPTTLYVVPSRCTQTTLSPQLVDAFWAPADDNMALVSRIYEFDFVDNTIFWKILIKLAKVFIPLTFAQTAALFAYADAFPETRGGVVLSVFKHVTSSLPYIEFKIQGPKDKFQLLASCLKLVQDKMGEMSTTSNPIISALVSCTHALPPTHMLGASPTHESSECLSLRECVDAYLRSETTVKFGETEVELGLVIPEITFAHFPAALVVKAEEVTPLGMVLGEGAYGTVDRCAMFWRHIVIARKILVPQTSMPNVIHSVYEFCSEAWTLASVTHPSIVGLIGVMSPPPTICMEVLPYGTLFQFLHETTAACKVDWTFKVKVALNIAEGMKYLHSKSPPILHLDLKSPNILMMSLENTTEVLAKLCDLGSARASYFPLTTRCVDNPTWLAPEILAQKPYHTPADVYSFGVVLYEIAMQRTYYGDERFFSEIERKVLLGERPEITSKVPAAISALIMSCWASSPAHRPTFTDIVDLLREIQAEGIKNF